MYSDLRHHHVGIACRDIRKTLEFLTRTHRLQGTPQIIYDPSQDAEVCLVTTADGARTELVSGRVVENLIKKGMSYYHVCYEVEDMDAAIAWLKEQHCLLVSPPIPAVLFDDRKVAFLYSPIGLIELLSAS
jgi:methylmalonyl-CoA/ethylmalonyl-CoA epimerase